MTALSLPLPFALAGLGALSQGQQSPPIQLQASAAPNSNPAYFPDPASRPHTDIEIRQMYIPLAILVAGNPYGPTSGTVQLMLQTASRLCWAYSEDITLTPDANQPVYTTGTLMLAEDLVNPVIIAETEQPWFSTSVAFSGATTGGFLYMAAQIEDPQQTPPPIVGLPGAVYYTVP